MAAKMWHEHTGVDTIVPYSIEISTARVIFTNGDNLEGKGVAPDIKCLPTQQDIQNRRDVCFRRALFEARKALGITAPPKQNEEDGSKEEDKD